MNKTDYPEKKVAIFKAALDTIATNGFHDAPIARIALKAGVGIGTIYRYFESKDELIHELFKYIEIEMLNTILKEYDPDIPPKEQFVRFCRSYIQYSVDNPMVSSYFQQYIDSPYGNLMRKENFYGKGEDISNKILPHPFYQLFNRAKKLGMIKDLPNTILFVLIAGSLTHFIRDIRLGFINYKRKSVNNIVSCFWDTIKI